MNRFAVLACWALTTTGLSQGTEAGSQHVQLPGSSTPVFTAVGSPAAGDSAAVRAGRGAACPAGSFWAHAWGVASCLQAHQVCDAAVLQWQAGDAICQGVAPAGAAVHHVVSYSRRGDGSVQENYTLQAAAPRDIASRADMSPSHGYATVACVAGAWTPTASTCDP